VTLVCFLLQLLILLTIVNKLLHQRQTVDLQNHFSQFELLDKFDNLLI